MKAAFLLCAFLLAGYAICSPVEPNHISLANITIPDWILDLISDVELPEAVQNIIDKLPEIIADFPDIVDSLPDILEQIVEKIPEVIEIITDKLPEIELPDWWPELHILEHNVPTPGVSTTVSEFPSIVQIEFGVGPVWTQRCTATVLTSVHVLSAARCFSGLLYDPRFRRVRAGSSSRYIDGSIVGVAGAVNHPSFDASNSLDGDISVVRLSTNLLFGTTIQRTSIVPQGAILPTGLGVTLAGWGSTAEGKLISDIGLYKIDLTTTDNESCAERWRLFPLSITDDMICIVDAEYGGRNGDLRDIGAPVYYQNILLGVQSFSVPVGNQYFPVVTTAVSSYTDWIVETAV